jgi:DNA-binding NarL/FixJ family response regulator
VIKVMLADDEDLVRSGLRTILTSAGDIEVVAECDDGLHVAELARQHRPHVALLDIRMRSADGLFALRRLRALPDPPKVAMLTTFDVDEYVTEALRIGASGFLLKDTEPADLLQAIEIVAHGEALLSPSVTRTLISEFVARPPDRSTAPGLECLTRREREVTALAARGLTNEEIAAHMVISPFTAKTHISRAMTKLGARDRAQLVVFAYESGLVAARGHAE